MRSTITAATVLIVTVLSMLSANSFAGVKTEIIGTASQKEIQQDYRYTTDRDSPGILVSASSGPSPNPNQTKTDQNDTVMCVTGDDPLKIINKRNIVIDGSCNGGVISSTSRKGRAYILVKNSSNVTIKNLAFKIDDKLDSVISIINSKNIVIQNNTFAGGKPNAPVILGRSVNGGAVEQIVIKDNQFIDSPSISVVFDSWKYFKERQISGITIEKNRFENVYQAVRFVQHVDYSKNKNRPQGIVIKENFLKNISHVGIIAIWGNERESKITGNRLENICSDTDRKCNAISCEFCEGGEISENSIASVGNCKDCKGDGAGIILDWAHKQTEFSSSDITVSRNTITNCRHDYGGGGIILWKARNASVFSNMLIDNRNGIILRNEETKNNLIYNNEIEQSNFGISVKSKASKNFIYNNKIIDNHIDILVQDSKQVNHYSNNYYEKCKGCSPKNNITSKAQFDKLKCSGGTRIESETEPFVDIDGMKPASRPVGARSCQ